MARWPRHFEWGTSEADQLIERDRELAELIKWEQTLLAVKQELAKERDALPKQRRPWEHSQFDLLSRAIGLVEIGVTPDDVPHPVLSALVREPGLRDTRIFIARLTRECEELREHVARWPTPETTHPYRYVGRPNGRFNGQELMPGDVLELTQTRAKNLVNIFEPV